MIKSKRPILSFFAYSGTGKTTLIEQLIPKLKQNKIRVALIKHSHHDFDIDTPGKDSYRFRKAGALQAIVASKKRWALMVEQQNIKTEPQLIDLINTIDPTNIELIIVEGFKHENINKIALHRKDHPQKTHRQVDSTVFNDKNIIALASDDSKLETQHLPKLDINNIDQITQFICQYVKEQYLKKSIKE